MTEKQIEAVFDACYDEGFDDAILGERRCVDCGDFRYPYDAGYDDGLNSTEG